MKPDARFSQTLFTLIVLALLGLCAAISNSAHAQSASASPSAPAPARIPTLFLAGDSTMHPGGTGMLMGWGDALPQFFDPAKIHIENHALAGRSSRSFIEDARGWEPLRAKIQKGDFVFIQFGHNDDEAEPLNVTRFRFTLPGIGEESGVFDNPLTNQKVTIHSYGWYMNKMIADVQAAGASPIVLSSVPRNSWADGKIIRGEANHGPWAKQVADKAKVPFININELIAQVYDPLGQAKCKTLFFTTQDNTHTSPNGAKLSAACAILGLLQLKDCPLNTYLLPDAAAKAKEIKDATKP